jgi:hypothetical protein
VIALAFCAATIEEYPQNVRDFRINTPRGARHREGFVIFDSTYEGERGP